MNKPGVLRINRKHTADQVTPAGLMAIALADTGKHVYAGTVPGHVIKQRRAANKRARKARRATR